MAIGIATITALADEARTNRATAQSQLSFTSFPNPSRPNGPFTLTAIVSGGGPVPTGTVTFASNLCPQPCAAPTGPIGTAPLDSAGRAILMFGGFSVPGSYGFEAVYNGDSNYSSSSGSLIQVVAVDVPIPTLEVETLIFLALLLAAAGSLFLWKGNG